MVSFQWFSLALDESIDIQDTAQLLIYLRGIDDKFETTEKLLLWSLSKTLLLEKICTSVSLKGWTIPFSSEICTFFWYLS